MLRLNTNRSQMRRTLLPTRPRRSKHLWLFVVGSLLLSSCGSSSHNNPLLLGPQLSGNWQFTVAPPGDQSFTGGLQGGFLVQDNNSLTGSIAFSVASPTPSTVCNSGSAAVTGTISGQNISLTAVA